MGFVWDRTQGKKNIVCVIKCCKNPGNFRPTTPESSFWKRSCVDMLAWTMMWRETNQRWGEVMHSIHPTAICKQLHFFLFLLCQKRHVQIVICRGTSMKRFPPVISHVAITARTWILNWKLQFLEVFTKVWNKHPLFLLLWTSLLRFSLSSREHGAESPICEVRATCCYRKPENVNILEPSDCLCLRTENSSLLWSFMYKKMSSELMWV